MVQKVGQRVGEQFSGKKWFRECEFSSDGARKANLDFHNWFAISLQARTSRQLIPDSVRVYGRASLGSNSGFGIQHREFVYSFMLNRRRPCGN